MSDPILIYFSDRKPELRIEEDFDPSGWWVRIGNYDPAGPFDSEKNAVNWLNDQYDS
jgi:hypothetical protein